MDIEGVWSGVIQVGRIAPFLNKNIKGEKVENVHTI